MNPSQPTTPASGTVTDGSVVENALLGGNRMNAPLTETAERIYDKLVEEPKGEPKNEPTESEQKSTETTTNTETKTEENTPTTETTTEPTGHFVDEGLTESKPEPAPAPQPDPVLPQNFNELEQYIAKNIGQPINVRIKVGDQVRSVQAYSPANLPEGFEFASESDRLNAQLGFDSLTRKAESLQAKFENEQAQKSAQDFSAQEDADIQRDIAYLQRQKASGKDGLNLFKTLDPNDPEFENDPAVKEMQEVLEYYNAENQARWQQVQRNGGQYRPLTYRDAFKLYRIDNPVVGEKQAKEDAERKEISKPLAKANETGTGDAGKQPRPKLGRYATVDQIIQAYKL